MTGSGKIIAAAAVAAALAATGLGLTLAQQSAGEDIQKGQAMTTTHEIGVTNAGVFTPIATVTFDASNTGTLVLGKPHLRTPQLVQVWADVSKRDQVRIEKTVHSDPGSGEDTVGLMSVLVKKTDPAFPDALLRLMAHEYGFDSRP